MYSCIDIDFETRSQVDLKKHGLARYASDPSTSVICMAYAVNVGEVKIWWGDEPMPAELIGALESNCPIYAHNADFERHIFDFVMFEDYGVKVDLSRWRCTMVMALAHGLPGALGDIAEAMNLPVQKQKHGTRLIREYCATGHLTEFKEGDRELMAQYCIDDVRVMMCIRSGLRELTDGEWAEYHLTCRINDIGLPVDVPFVTAALEYADDISADVDKKIAELTDGMMTKHTQRKGRDAWLFPKLTEKQMKSLRVWKNGKEKISLDEEHRGYLLAFDDLDPDARSLVELINDAGSAALKKYAAAAHQHIDGRVHNTFLFHGAQTGRYSGKGIQPHNFRRDAFSDSEAVTHIQDILEGYEVQEPTVTMARLLRSMIVSPKGIHYVDWSAIEGRVAPWLAHNEKGEKKLNLYREGKDVYISTAADMFNVDEDDLIARVDAEEKEAKGYRQAGKVCELSLQYAGGKGALQGMARNYGMTFEDDEAENLVRLWRKANPWATTAWPVFEQAALAAVRKPGKPFDACRCTFQSDGTFLWCRLPSGRFLAYYRPRFEAFETPWGEERMGATFQTSTKVKQEDRKKTGKLYHRNHLRGGLIFQNAVQAIAADVLRDTLLKSDGAGLRVVGHVHDEIIVEGPYADGELLQELMLTNPTWAEGLPLATGGVMGGLRYGK